METVQRATTYSRWPRGVRDNLVVAIEDLGGQRKFTCGPAANPIRLARSYTRYRNLECDPQAPDIGGAVPESLLDQVFQACEAAVRKLVGQHGAVATEEGATGLFVGDMNAAAFSYDGWEATIYLQGFSPETKEPKVGADFGAVVDVRHAGERVVKGFFAQAKRVDGIPDDPSRLQDLLSQIPAMLAKTGDAYVLIYGSHEVQFRHARHPREPLSVSTVMGDVVRCKRGDRSPMIIAEALDRDLVLEVAIAGPGAVWPSSRGPLP